jgi:integrase
MPRTGENIYKRKDGRWEGRYLDSYQSNGKGKYKSVYGKSYSVVRQKLREATSSSANHFTEKTTLCTDLQPTLLSDLADKWMQSVRMKVKESTYSRYFLILQTHVLPKLGNTSAEELTTVRVEEFLTELLTGGRKDQKGGLSGKTVKDILGLLKEIILFAQRNEISTKCLLNNISLKYEKKEKEILSETDRTRLISYLIKELEPIKVGIILSLYTGLRIGELCALRWQEIDLKSQILSIKYTLQRIQDFSQNRQSKTKLICTSPKSKSSVRLIPLPDFLISFLKPWESASDAYLLSGVPDKVIEPRFMQLRFKKYLKEIGIRRVNFHCLRHTFSTMSLRSGMDIKTLSELLGHSNVNITLNEYVHSSLEYKRESMNKLQEIPVLFEGID